MFLANGLACSAVLKEKLVVAQPIRPVKLKEYKKGWDINAHKEMTNAFENLGGKLIDTYICEGSQLDPRGTGCLDLDILLLAQNRIG
jgi:hypothetical protein